MSGRHVRAAVVVTSLMAAVFVPDMHADVRAQRRDADLLRQKVATINAHAEHPTRQGRRTTVTQNELNAYFVFDGREQLPTGVVEPFLNIIGTGRVSGRAVVDLDAVRREKGPTSLLDPMNYLMGRLPVRATGVLKSSNGIAHFELESASVGPLPIPKILLQEIVSYYSRTPANPAGIGLDDAFALPARIREIQVQRGQAIIVQ